MRFVIVWFLMISYLWGNDAVSSKLITIAYHDVVLSYDNQGDSDCITQSELIKQFQWLKENGYTVIHPNDLIAYQEGKKDLPPKAVLLTFDDAYTSFYTIVYPLLRAFNYPAIVAVVGSWIEEKEKGKAIQYDNFTLSPHRLVSWAQLREMVASGLVEVASHSYKHHKGATANPQGSEQPLFVTRVYDKATGSYETFDHYKARITKDFKESQTCFSKHLGKKVRLMIWPYGAFNQHCIDAAKKAGLKIFFSLEDENIRQSPINFENIGRLYFTPEVSFKNFLDFIRGTFKTAGASFKGRRDIFRAVRLDLDQIFSSTSSDFNKNLDLVVDRVYKYQINTVILKGFSGKKEEELRTYFPNRHLSIKADILNKVAWQIYTKTQSRIFVWMPMSLMRHAQMSEQKIKEVYEDLAFSVPIDGILFHDDDRSKDQREDLEYSKTIISSLKKFRLPFLTVYSKHAQDFLQNASLQDLLQTYDYVLMTSSTQPHETVFINDHLDEICEKVKEQKGGLQKTIFELQTLNWQKGCQPIDASDLLEKTRNLSAKGVFHFSLFPDNPIKNQPDIATIKEAISKQSTIFIP